MRSITLEFEDKLFTNLKQSADSKGYSVDNYILYLLTGVYDEDKEANSENNIDSLLSSMQFHSGKIPVSENGKGAVAEMKYL